MSDLHDPFPSRDDRSAPPEPTDPGADRDESGTEATPDSASADARPSAPRRCTPFNPRSLQRQLAMDAALRWALLLIFLAAIIWTSSQGSTPAPAAMLPLIIIVFAWIGLGTRNARVVQRLAAVTAVMDSDAEKAESILSEQMRRWALQRSVRVLLYHRLAMLRHRQRRFGESAAISQTLLLQSPSVLRSAGVLAGMGTGQAASALGLQGAGTVADAATSRTSSPGPPAPAPMPSGALGRPRTGGGLRAHLLLMNAEARLQAGDIGGAYPALAELYAMPLSLIEALQRLALQTQYEIASGQDAAAVSSVDRKLQLSELMPPPQCGAMHALLAVAARRLGESTLADWLTRRAELISTREQIETLLGGVAGSR